MARRVSDTFRAGMITDVIGAPGSVSELSDMYVRKAGELSCRGAMPWATASAASANYSAGWSQAQFHPNLGLIACRGSVAATAASGVHISSATRFEIMSAPLPTATGKQALSFSFLSESTTKDQIPLHSGVATAASAATGIPVERIISMTNAGDEVVMAGELGSIYKWGGSQYPAYNSGTVSIASASAGASRIITGSGGQTWLTSAQEGQYILIDGIGEKANTFQRAYRITKVISNTQLEIELPIFTTGTASGITYRIQSLAVIQSPDGVWNGTNQRPTSVGVCTYHQGKIFAGGVSDRDTAYNTVFNLDRIRWSGTIDENGTFEYAPATATASASQATGTKANASAHHFSYLDLWHPNAYIDVFPGIGGSIRGLVSMGNELVVIKSHGMFRITGSTTYDGTGSGVGVQIISLEVGANGFNAWTMTSRGLVIASRDGLYLYDGENVQSLTDGRIKRWWEANYSGHEYAMTQFEDKVIVGPVFYTYGTNGVNNRLVWDAEQNLFWTISHNHYELNAGCSVYTDSDEYVGDYGFPAGAGLGDVANSANKWHYEWLTDINHKLGYNFGWGATAGVGPWTTDSPKPAVVTQPFPLGDDAVSEGRLNNILVHAAVCSGATASVINATAVTGHSYFGISNENSGIEETGMSYAITEGIRMAATATDQDRVVRIPVEGIQQAPSVRICLDTYEGGWGDWALTHQYLRIFAIGIDYTQSNVVGPS